ncbi:MAG: type II toxin-antitoxin system prevent-host-death family antitoxin [Polyangiaceae bacterium]|nr:type II toxin-antitoxin system prevent-host-death family antitoxin [Polyangiaceae bacterium]
MATNAVGVRELKLHAPALVNRARNGERIVITRYGRPHAQLCPLEEPAVAEPPLTHPRMAAWHAERRAFEQLLPRLERRYRGRYVAIYGGRVVGSDGDPDALFERIWQKHPGRTIFIGRVGGPPPIVEMPGFEIE